MVSNLQRPRDWPVTRRADQPWHRGPCGGQGSAGYGRATGRLLARHRSRAISVVCPGEPAGTTRNQESAMFDMTGQASGRAGAPPHRWRQVGRRVIGAGAALIIGTAGVGLLAGQAYAAVSGQPGAAGAVRACRTWNRSESQFADVAARTVRTAAAQAAVAARADGRWSVLATDL